MLTDVTIAESGIPFLSVKIYLFAWLSLLLSVGLLPVIVLLLKETL